MKLRVERILMNCNEHTKRYGKRLCGEIIEPQAG